MVAKLRLCLDFADCFCFSSAFPSLARRGGGGGGGRSVSTLGASQLRKLRHPYVSLLVRRGDKTRENTQPINVSTIVEFLDAVTVNGTLTREVFVGTDDCRSLSELKQASRRYTFKNLCGKSWELGWKQSPELKKQNLTDHYIKFFGELLAMSASDIFLGDHLSSVHHFVAYMRPLSSTEKSVFTMRKASSVW